MPLISTRLHDLDPGKADLRALAVRDAVPDLVAFMELQADHRLQETAQTDVIYPSKGRIGALSVAALFLALIDEPAAAGETGIGMALSGPRLKSSISWSDIISPGWKQSGFGSGEFLACASYLRFCSWGSTALE